MRSCFSTRDRVTFTQVCLLASNGTCLAAGLEYPEPVTVREFHDGHMALVTECELSHEASRGKFPGDLTMSMGTLQALLAN